MNATTAICFTEPISSELYHNFLLNLTLNFKDENIAIPEIYYLEEEKKNLSFPFALYLILLM